MDLFRDAGVLGWGQLCQTQALESAQSSQEVELRNSSSTRRLGPLGSPVPDRDRNRQRIGAEDPGVSN